MEWMTAIRESIRYMEDNIMTVSGPAEVASHVNMSEMYLQRGFQVVTGFTLGEYVRNRRLYLAAMDLIDTDDKIIDIALRYGYETPESFTKAFGRFHDSSPTQIRKHEKIAKAFLPMHVTMVVKGGEDVEVKIKKHDGFRLIGPTWNMMFEEHRMMIPVLLDEFENKYLSMLRDDELPSNINRYDKAIYDNRIGIFDAYTNIGVGEGCVRFMIAGEYAGGDVPEGMEVWTIPGSEWAEFSCIGPLHTTVDNIKKYIWYEWFPGNMDYEIGGDYFVTKYSRDKRTDSPDYHCMMWLPVRKKNPSVLQ